MQKITYGRVLLVTIALLLGWTLQTLVAAEDKKLVVQRIEPQTLAFSRVFLNEVNTTLALKPPSDKAREKYKEKLAKLDRADKAAILKFAVWCKKEQLKTESEALYKDFYRLHLVDKRKKLAAKPSLAAYKKLIKWCSKHKLKTEVDALIQEKILFEYEGKKAKMQPPTVKGHMALADWCTQQKLEALAKKHYRAVIKEEPDNPKARKALAYTRFEDTWLTSKEVIAKYISTSPETQDALVSQLIKGGYQGSKADLQRWANWTKAKTGLMKNQKVPSYTQKTAYYHINVPASCTVKKAVPLVIYLHGGGNNHAGNADQIVSYHAVLDSMKDKISLFPNHIIHRWANRNEMRYLMDTISHVTDHWRIDPKRIYLMGASMGGNGTWVVGATFSEVFAAIGPQAGYWGHAPSGTFKNLYHKPVYIAHGIKDKVVGIATDRKYYKILKQNGCNVHMEEIDCGHQLPPDEVEKCLKWLLQYTNKDTLDWKVIKERASALQR